MSYLGRKPIKIPNQVKITLENNRLSVEGPLGSNERVIHSKIELDIKGDLLTVKQPKRSNMFLCGGFIENLLQI